MYNRFDFTVNFFFLTPLSFNFYSIGKRQNRLFNLGMFTYSYDGLNIIQTALKRLPEDDSKKTLSDLALPLHIVKELLKKCPNLCT
jgi:hypothetical protein